MSFLFLKENCVNKVSLKIYSKIPSVVVNIFTFPFCPYWRELMKTILPKILPARGNWDFFQYPKRFWKATQKKICFLWFCPDLGKGGFNIKEFLTCFQKYARVKMTIISHLERSWFSMWPPNSEAGCNLFQEQFPLRHCHYVMGLMVVIEIGFCHYSLCGHCHYVTELMIVIHMGFCHYKFCWHCHYVMG